MHNYALIGNAVIHGITLLSIIPVHIGCGRDALNSLINLLVYQFLPFADSTFHFSSKEGKASDG